MHVLDVIHADARPQMFTHVDMVCMAVAGYLTLAGCLSFLHLLADAVAFISLYVPTQVAAVQIWSVLKNTVLLYQRCCVIIAAAHPAQH